jgi:hypothetical protein
MLQLIFDYNLDKDTPGRVAEEMANALSLDKEDVSRLEFEIEQELSILI